MIKKNYLKSKPVCKVTFKLDAEGIKDANTVSIVGEFNKWKPKKDQMKKLKNGTFTHTMDLEVGKSYQFRYLVDGKSWINEDEADDFVPSGISMEQNSVLNI